MNPMPAQAAVLPWEAMVNSTFPSGTFRSPGFDDPNNILAFSMVTFNDYVYVSNFNFVTGTEIWRTKYGTDWEQVNVDCFGIEAEANVSYAILAVFNNNLYAFNWLWIETHVDVYRYNSVPIWDKVATIDNTIGPTAAIVYNNTLYVSLVTGGKSAIYGSDSDDDTTWTPSNADGFGGANVAVQSMAIYNNRLYAGTSNASGTEVWRFDGSNWAIDNNIGFNNPENVGTGSLTSFGGALYASTDNSDTGAEVWKTSGGGAADWIKVSEDGFGQGAGTSCISPGSGSAVFKNKLYIGASDAKVFRTADGTLWEQVNTNGFGDDNLFVIFSVLGDYLYAGTGTLPEGIIQGDTTEIYRYYEPTAAAPETLPQTGMHVE